ncbi:MAG: hypothetical protein NTV34_09720 [Proteobacteria bacterium]|nr:hypothetical protein [Pseudomonadota bacterium]
MNCQLASSDILDFHFGSLVRERRSVVEGHLFECKECLKEYLHLKADIELSQAADAQPSPFTRHTIKADFSAYATKQRKIPVVGFLNFQSKLVMGGLAAVATIAVVIASINFRKKDAQQPLSTYSIEQVRTLDNAIDSGSRNPDSINIL